MTLAKRLFLSCFLIGVLFLFYRKEIVLSGETMGSTYHIRVYTPLWVSKASLQQEVDGFLHGFSSVFSTYDARSELSLLNQAPSFTPVKVSSSLYYLLLDSLYMYQVSSGVFDPTVKPLIELWKASVLKKQEPSSMQISHVLDRVGFHYLDLSVPYVVVKRKEGLVLDLSAIAAGYAVDLIAESFDSRSFTSYLIEVTGEVRVGKPKPFFRLWSLGVASPSYDSDYDSVYGVTYGDSMALSTSGDYRRYVTLNGRHYSHVFDPRTGYPVSSSVASVTVKAPTARQADALSTVLCVLPYPEGLKLIHSLKEVEALFLIRKGKKFSFVKSFGFGTIRLSDN